MKREMRISPNYLQKAIEGDVESLDYAFSWRESEEGYEYWGSVVVNKQLDPEVLKKLLRIAKNYQLGNYF